MSARNTAGSPVYLYRGALRYHHMFTLLIGAVAVFLMLPSGCHPHRSRGVSSKDWNKLLIDALRELEHDVIGKVPIMLHQPYMFISHCSQRVSIVIESQGVTSIA